MVDTKVDSALLPPTAVRSPVSVAGTQPGTEMCCLSTSAADGLTHAGNNAAVRVIRGCPHTPITG